MDKIIGKIFFIIWAMSAFSLHAQVTLKAYDMQGNTLEYIGMGQPFTLEVAVDGFSSLNNNPIINGLEKLYIRENGVMSVTINGKSTVKYTYKTRIDTLGVHSIGPATIVEKNQTYASNTISIKVVEPSVVSAQLDKKNGQSNSAFFRFTTDKKNVVIGEKIVCIVRFYYTNEVINVAPIEHPVVAGMHFDQYTSRNIGIEKINGIDYQCYEFAWNAYALEKGKINIPAYSIDFAVRSQNAHSSPLAMFFGHTASEQKRIYSNAISLNVDPLPPYQGTIHAIGSFNHFTAAIEPGIAKEGEGMVLSLEIEGDGVFDTQNSPITVSGMPDSLKYYESKEYIQAKTKPGQPTKNCFEFIVQGLQEGDQEIPRQTFTFFDVASRSYKTLHTLPLAVMILPGNKASKQFLPGDEPSTSIDAHNDDIAPICRVRPAMMVHSIQHMPWWLFFMFIALALFFVLYDHILRSRDLLSAYFFKRSHKKNAFKAARVKIANVAKNHQYAHLYPIFSKLFATHCEIDERSVDQLFMSKQLASSGISQSEHAQWDTFLSQLIEYVFFNKKLSINESHQRVKEAYSWIDRLEGLL